MRLLVFVPLLVGGALLYGQQAGSGRDTPVAEKPAELSGGWVVPLDVSMLSVRGNEVCDADGNLFFDMETMRVGLVNRGPIIRFPHDGNGHTLYMLPEDNAAFRDPLMAVSPDGWLTLVYRRKDGTQRLLRFGKDGKLSSDRALQAPEKLELQQLAVADSGVLLVKGYFWNKPEEQKGFHPGYEGMFDTQGALLHDLSGEAEEVDSTRLETHVPEGRAVGGGDGNFYIVGAKNIRVVNQSGEQEKLIPYTKANPDEYAWGAFYSEGTLAIELDTEVLAKEKGWAKTIKQRMLLIDTQNGEILGDYVLSDKIVGSVSCYTRQNGFSVFTIEHRKDAIHYVPIDR